MRLPLRHPPPSISTTTTSVQCVMIRAPPSESSLCLKVLSGAVRNMAFCNACVRTRVRKRNKRMCEPKKSGQHHKAIDGFPCATSPHLGDFQLPRQPLDQWGAEVALDGQERHLDPGVHLQNAWNFTNDEPTARASSAFGNETQQGTCTHLVDHAHVLGQLGRDGAAGVIHVNDDQVPRLLVRLECVVVFR